MQTGQYIVLPRLVRRRTIKLMSYDSALIDYIYLAKIIQKVNRGVLFLYEGVVLNGESH